MSLRANGAARLAAAGLALFGFTLCAGAAAPQGAKKKPAKTQAASKPQAAQPAANATQIAQGKKVYAAATCSGCHAIAGKGGSAGPDLSATGAAPGHTVQWLAVQVTNPKAHNPNTSMPASPQIKGADLTALATYLASLKGAVAASTPGASTAVMKIDPAVVAKVEKAGGTARQIAQNDNHVEVSFRMATGVTDASLAALVGLKKIIHLDLARTPITDAGLAHIKGLTELEELHLEGTKITDRGLANLKGMKALSYLNVYDTQVTDAGLDELAGLTNLKHLYVWQTKVTPAGAEKLKKALPKCEIVTGFDTAPAPAPKP